jgi:hypothetical protein
MFSAYDFENADWRTVAAEYNCLMIPQNFGHNEAATKAKMVLAALRLASQAVPAHPEIQHTGVIFGGWSQGAVGAGLVADQPELINRMVAIVGMHLISGTGANVYGGSYRPVEAALHFNFRPPLSVPYLFLSAGAGDFASDLSSNNPAVVNQAAAGAPLTMVGEPLHDHSDIFEAALTCVWLEEVLKPAGMRVLSSAVRQKRRQ